MRNINSPVKFKLIEKFNFPFHDFFTYVQNCNDIKSIISTSAILFPDLVEVDNMIFVKQFYQYYDCDYSKSLQNDSENIEKYINLFPISDFFLLSKDIDSIDITWQLELGEILLYYWGKWLNINFPLKDFELILSETGMFSETGICISFHQKYSIASKKITTKLARGML